MKISKKIIISSLSTALGVSMVGAISGTVAWYQYNTAVRTSLIGMNVAETGVLEISATSATTGFRRDLVTSDLGVDTTSIIKGDLKSITISAASIIAKVTRDRMMEELDKKYPMYGFKDNAGYGTKKHIEAIEKYGIIKEHRKTFKPVCYHLDHINK